MRGRRVEEVEGKGGCPDVLQMPNNRETHYDTREQGGKVREKEREV